MSTLTIPTRRPPTPGDILVGEFLEPLGVTQRAFAEAIGITPALQLVDLWDFENSPEAKQIRKIKKFKPKTAA